MAEKLRKEVLASVPQAQNYQVTNPVKVEAEVTPLLHEALTADHFPRRGAGLEDIIRFAYTFDGYAHYGMEACAALANAALSAYYHHETLPDDLTELRACLFFEARRWTLYQSAPDTKATIYIFALIDRIKTMVTNDALSHSSEARS